MVNKIPLVDSYSFYKKYSDEIDSAMLDVLNSENYILGENVQKFEDRYSNYCGTRYCVGVGNGTDALVIALKSLGIGEKDQVACVANAGFYSSTAIFSVGANPLYIDVDYDKMTMCSIELEKNITQNTKAVIVTHLYGQMADIEALIKVSKKLKIPVIEDCAQAHGAEINGKKAGSWGDIGCFSFYPTKNLGALGDAGAIVTSNEKIDKMARRLRQYGWSKKYIIDQQIGVNSRMDEIQAAILNVKLSYLDKMNQNRIEIANLYNSFIVNKDIIKPKPKEREHVFHLYVIRHTNRDVLKNLLSVNGFHCDIHYPIPDYEQKVVRENVDSTKLSCTNTCCNRVLSLPINLTNDKAQFELLVEILNKK